ncbi:amidohydrolase family protein [Synechococcales cyanobacterium C]|uniref:Amidohydrolase family protein n=1 Tax=Petrachloros mirabilis ULC683 TaxID=2781853 RepID=A0A8K2A020_9CYAN|nr:amidohydrolase family protein [Petrachloros mirabilis]NCJ07261.1 amidohydrolase family protein [Petrachloros mirabilis ULC683]
MSTRSRYLFALGALLLGLFGLITQVSFAQNPAPDRNSQSGAVLFEDVRIFDGVSNTLSAPSNVLVIGNKIQAIDTRPLPIPADISVTRLNGAGRVLMPGLIDVHTHLFMETSTQEDLIAAATAPERLFQRAQENATGMLMRGFTSVRDLAGPVFELKRAIDRGTVVGPRIWPSGAMISQTSGHGDFREMSDLPRTPTSELSLAERFGVGAIADGVDEVLRRTREQLMMGASQIKLAAGGGVASDNDPLDVSQYTEAELKAAVDAAEDWNTYVAVHAYTPRSIQKSIRAGVKSIEHGQLLDDATARMIAENDVWLSMQPFLDDEDANPYPEGSENRAKQLMVSAGTDNAYNLAKQYNIKTAWGSDNLFNPRGATRQGAKLAKLVRWYTPAEVLKMATSTNAELLALSGSRNPYPGKLGVVQAEALADLLLVNGDPLANIRLIEDPARNFLVIMKDGVIYKNQLS